MEDKKQFPQNELQKRIYDFWSVRGYSIAKAVLGNLYVSLHRENPKYEENGLCYQYLEQFYLEAKKEVIDDIEKLNNHPLKKDGCFHTELIRSDIDKLKQRHLSPSKKEDADN